MTQELSTKQKPTYMQITVSGTTYDCMAQVFSVASLKLDPGNGRLQHLPKQLSQEEVFEQLSGKPDTKKLKDSIAQVRGLMEMPYVKLLPEEDNFEALLREGNRRKVSLQLILDGIETGKLDLDRKDYETVKAWVYPSHMPDEHQLLHIANMHSTEAGKKNWAKLNQAAFITTLRDNPKISDDDIVKGLQVSKSTLTKQAKAYKQTMKYGDLHKNEDLGWKEKYSHFERLFSQRVLKEWFENPDNMKLYMEWVFANKIQYPHKVAQIKKILLEPKLLKKFTESGSEYKLEQALYDAEKNQKLKDNAKEISMKCDQAVDDLNDFLFLIPDKILESKSLNKYVECVSQLEKFVGKVNALKKR